MNMQDPVRKPRPKGTLLQHAPWRTRTINALLRSGYTFVEEVQSQPDKVLLAVRNLGPIGIAEIRGRKKP